MTADLDDRLRDALAAEVTDVTTSDELWHRIRASAAARPGRTAHRPGGRTRWYLLSAAAAALLAVGAVAVWAQHDAHRATETNPAHPATPTTTAPAPTTTPSTAPPTTAAPTTETPTTQLGQSGPPPGVDPFKPLRAVAVLADGRMVTLDLKHQTILGEIDREYSGSPGAEGGVQALDSVDASPDTDDIWYTDCCEPAIGNVYHTTRSSTPATPRTRFGNGTAVAVGTDGQHLAVLSDALRVLDPTGKVVATASGIDASLLDGKLWWSPDGAHLAVGMYSSADGGRIEAVRLLRWDGRTLTVDHAFAPIRANAIRWSGGRPVALPSTINDSHPTSDGNWTVAVGKDGTLHLFGPDGRDTTLFAGTKFADADALEDWGD